MIAPGTVAGWIPWLLVHERTPASGLVLALAIGLFGLGGAIYTWCVWDFASFGRGTPAPIDAPRKLVIRGLYRWVRNPMYVGVLTVILAWALWFQAASLVVYALGVAACFHAFIRLYEEPHLARQFEAEYEAYRERVGRWIPRL